MTVRHLMTHASGLSRHTGRELLSGRGGKTLEQSVRELSTVQLLHAPGSRYEYSNSNYLLLALIVEALSGEPFSQYIERHIFQPLAMRHSFAFYKQAVAAGLAQGHRWWFGWPVAFTAPYLYDAQGAAFLISSIQDMARWLLLDGIRVLSPAGMKELHRGQMPTGKKGAQAAMGWGVEQLAGESVVRRGGEVSNFRADMILVPDRDLGIVTLQNCNNGVVAQLSLDQIAANVLRIMLDQPVLEVKPTFSQIWAGFDIAVFVLTAVQVWLWCVLAFSAGPAVPLALLLVLETVGSVWVFLWLPRRADMSWRGLWLYVPDLSMWLSGMATLMLVINVVTLLKWLLLN